ncbi:unnamed protein product [Ilex paraguariensis]
MRSCYHNSSSCCKTSFGENNCHWCYCTHLAGPLPIVLGRESNMETRYGPLLRILKLLPENSYSQTLKSQYTY